MLGHAARSPDLRVIPTSALNKADPKVAVLLNLNAHQVTERVVKSLSHVVAKDDLFVSRSREDVARIVHQLLERKYDTVFCGGGDGTFTGFLNELCRQLETHARPAPKIGILKLGTGNALAALVRASPLRGDRILDDVLRARAGEVPGYRRIDVLTVNGRKAVFAGVGLDAKILNDYGWVKGKLAKGLLSKVMSGPSGYFTSVALRTVPHVVTQPTMVQMRLVNGDAAAFRLGSDGAPLQEFAPGALLFEGKVNLASAGTAPYFGYEIRAFPFAGQRRGMMHVRFGAYTAHQVIANLGKMWSGTWFPEFQHDFHVASATMEFERPMPLQIGGDAEGYHHKVELGMAQRGVELVDFSGSVQ